jgi:hypothetical protein
VITIVCAAGNICHDPKGLTQNKEEYIVRYLDKLLVTTYEFSAVTKEIKGFPREEFNKFLGRSADDSKALTLARGATLGGTREYLEVATTIFDSILAETLAAGYLGTEENILRWASCCSKCSGHSRSRFEAWLFQHHGCYSTTAVTSL